MITDPENISKVEDTEPLQKSSKENIEKDNSEDDQIGKKSSKPNKILDKDTEQK